MTRIQPTQTAHLRETTQQTEQGMAPEMKICCTRQKRYETEKQNTASWLFTPLATPLGVCATFSRSEAFVAQDTPSHWKVHLRMVILTEMMV